ncbi:MAG TPA: glycosyltransferase [Chitinophagaceae bacterium]|nr:glycosyltransferase [Chitinophagaceae bacterium]
MALLSVLMITYNHEKYIAQAIEGALMQQTDFSFEIIIGEDCSKDKTLMICREYAKTFPEKIRLLENEENIGMMPNFIKTFKECSGKYIALCEGDDYWTDPLKLQKQVSFLEANPGYTICFHRVYELINGKSVLSQLNIATEETTYTINDLATGNFMHTPSVVFKNIMHTGFPTWFSASPVGDYPLHLLNAAKGLIRYMPKPMGIYRRHDGGIWSNIKSVQRSEKWLLLLQCLLQENFTNEVKKILQQQVTKYQEKHLKALMQEDDWKVFLEKLSQYTEESMYISRKWLLEYYPAYIESIKKSKSYRYAHMVKLFVKRLRR